MVDVIKRLRYQAAANRKHQGCGFELLDEAANEINRLRAEMAERDNVVPVGYVSKDGDYLPAHLIEEVRKNSEYWKPVYTHPPRQAMPDEWRRFAEQVISDLEGAHAELMKAQGANPEEREWPAWSPQANTIRWAKDLLTAAPEPQQRAVPEGWMPFPVEAWEFLRGAGPLDGKHFGDVEHDDKTGRPRRYWWRSHIRAMLANAPEIQGGSHER